jgi:hypothetical protein
MLVSACGGRAVDSAGGGSSAGAGDHPDAGTAGDSGGGWSDVLGVYGACSYAQFGVASGSGGALTLSGGSSGTLVVTYASAYDAGPAFSLDFTATSSTSATLEPTGQPIPWEAFCFAANVMPNDSGFPPDPVPTELTLRLASGALTYDAQTIYLSVVVDPSFDAAVECEGNTAGTITCSKE